MAYGFARPLGALNTSRVTDKPVVRPVNPTQQRVTNIAANPYMQRRPAVPSRPMPLPTVNATPVQALPVVDTTAPGVGGARPAPPFRGFQRPIRTGGAVNGFIR